MENLYDVIIVGGGPGGLTAALYLARAKYRVLVLEKEQFGGQISITHEVVNYPGIAKTSGKALTDTIQQQAEHFGGEFLLAEATGFDLSGDIKTVHTNKGDYRCFGILLATGAHPRTVGFKGEEEHKGRGVAYCATCDGEFFTGKEVFVVGGGYAAAEESVFDPARDPYLVRLCFAADINSSRAAQKRRFKASATAKATRYLYCRFSINTSANLYRSADGYYICAHALIKMSRTRHAYVFSADDISLSLDRPRAMKRDTTDVPVDLTASAYRNFLVMLSCGYASASRNIHNTSLLILQCFSYIRDNIGLISVLVNYLYRLYVAQPKAFFPEFRAENDKFILLFLA